MKKQGYLYCILFFLLLLCQQAWGRHIKDTVHFRKAIAATHEIIMTDSALNDLGIDSILNKVEHIHNGLNDIINTTGMGFNIGNIMDNYAEADSNIDLIDVSLRMYDNVLDVKNLQMFHSNSASKYFNLS